MTEPEYLAEIARLHEFTLRLANRLWLAAEVLANRAMKRTPKESPMDLTKLPKWAQEHIRKLERERDTAVDALNKWTDEQTPSAIKITEMLNTGEKQGPSFKTRYIQGHRLEIDHLSVHLSVFLPREDDGQRLPGIELSWHTSEGTRGMLDQVALIPTSQQQVALVAKENMR